MGRPRQVSDEDILAVARDTFLELGPAVSTTVIAARLGLSQAALFKRFPRKEDLMVASLVPPAALGAWTHRADDGPDPRPLAIQIREMLVELDAHFSQLMPRLSVLQSCGISHREVFVRCEVPPPIAAIRTVAAWIGRAQETGRVRPEVDPTHLAMQILGPVQLRAFVHFLGTGPVGSDRFFDDVTALLGAALMPGEIPAQGSVP